MFLSHQRRTPGIGAMRVPRSTGKNVPVPVIEAAGLEIVGVSSRNAPIKEEYPLVCDSQLPSSGLFVTIRTHRDILALPYLVGDYPPRGLLSPLTPDTSGAKRLEIA